MLTKEYLEQRKSPDWKYTVVVDADAFQNVNQVHPLKQREVQQIVDAAEKDCMVKRIIIYGSAIRYDCDITSDLDICIDWKENCYDSEGVLKPFTRNMREAISKATKGNADVLNYDYLDDTDVESAVQKGVVVYEHHV